MANLSITLACNRDCAFCFGRSLREKGKASVPAMTRETFLQALETLRQSGIDQVRLLGGEPTLHPDFTWFARQALASGLRLLVFTNGLVPDPVLDFLEACPCDRLALLVNANPPGGGSLSAPPAQATTLQRLGEKVTLGLTICRPGTDPGFALDLIDRYRLNPTLRLGLAHPGPEGSNVFLHPKHYGAVGRRIAQLARRAAVCGVAIAFDCGFVPCMFPEDLFGLPNVAAADIGVQCGPIPDILPDGNAVACYPLAFLASVPLGPGSGTLAIKEQLSRLASAYRRLGILAACDHCALRKAGRCNGGCLAMAMQRLRSRPFAVGPVEPVISPKKHHRRIAAASTGRAANGAATGQPEGPGTGPQWAIPYIDQPLSFWQGLAEAFGDRITEVYLPLPGNLVGSGRPPQPCDHLPDFLRHRPFGCAVLINPVVLPGPVAQVAPRVIEALDRLAGEYDIVGATVANLDLAAEIRQALPNLAVCASVLMDIATPAQAMMLAGICDTLVPASRIMRDLGALKRLQAAFAGKIRLLVNESCLPGCPYRVQHFYEMAAGLPHPGSLCSGWLARAPWMRLTGAWVLPQHLHLYDGLFDELKLAGRVTLQDPARYQKVLGAYVRGEPLPPDQIGGGPASVAAPIDITDAFFAHTLTCDRQCHACTWCRDFYNGQQPTDALPLEEK